MPKEIINLSTLEMIDDMLKRLYTIENCLLKMTPVIDIANDYEDRLTNLEKEIQNMGKNKNSLPRDRNLELVTTRYKSLVQVIENLSMPDKFKANAILFMDSGLLWLAEGTKLGKHLQENENGEHGSSKSKDSKGQEHHEENQNEISASINGSQNEDASKSHSA